MTLSHNPAVIIPMAGHSSRFFNSGFDTYKAFLKIAGKTMLEGVIEPFGQNVDVFIITTKELVAENAEIFSAMPHNYTVITIKKHKLGPAYSIYLANDLIPRNRPYFIAYCDVWWRMEGFHISSFNEMDAAILTHEGFHPHLVADNFSAFCYPEEKSPKLLKKIKEKGSFTDDWMNEALSVGVFYCRNATLMLNAIVELIESKEKAADEFYPSMIYNILVDRGINVSLVNVDSFVHLGLPQHFNDIQSWISYIHNTTNILEKSSPLNCILLGGKGSRMRNISPLPKHLLPLGGTTMLEHILKRMNCMDNILICAPDTQLPLGLSEKVSVKELNKNTSS
ncbi:NTP transferase domain-containing protein, partial [Alphaproteobacteria bacterium]|nr:NTP transferase domain-containing protein [Alphaproteobacteria bacterium]